VTIYKQGSNNLLGSYDLAGQFESTSTSSLDALQNDEQSKILNIVDSLRQCGLDGILSLPQLVVVISEKLRIRSNHRDSVPKEGESVDPLRD
jgi:hypothetical protein